MDAFVWFLVWKKIFSLTIMMALIYLTRFGIIFICVLLKFFIYFYLFLCVSFLMNSSQISWGLGPHCLTHDVPHIRHSLKLLKGWMTWVCTCISVLIIVFSGPFLIPEPERAELSWLWVSAHRKQKQTNQKNPKTFQSVPPCLKGLLSDEDVSLSQA